MTKSTILTTLINSGIKVTCKGKFLEYLDNNQKIRIFYIITTNMRNKTKLRIYLKNKENVSSLYELDFDSSFLCEIMFENNQEIKEFEKELQSKFEIFDKRKFNVIESVKI